MVRSYHVKLTDGTERDITASAVEFPGDGTVQFQHVGGAVAVAYAPGAWTLVEVESRDDRGESGPETEPK